MHAPYPESRVQTVGNCGGALSFLHILSFCCCNPFLFRSYHHCCHYNYPYYTHITHPILLLQQMYISPQKAVMFYPWWYFGVGMQKGGREDCQQLCLRVTPCPSPYSSLIPSLFLQSTKKREEKMQNGVNPKVWNILAKRKDKYSGRLNIFMFDHWGNWFWGWFPDSIKKPNDHQSQELC